MRAIPDNNLVYPLLISLANGTTGSGFQLKDGDRVLVVTAKHVLFDDKGNLRAGNADVICQTADIDDDTVTTFGCDLGSMLLSGNVFKHPSRDVAGFLIGTTQANADGGYITTGIEGVTLKSKGNSEVVSVSAHDTVKFLKEVLISNDVFLYGYPSSLGLRQSPQFDYTKPLLRKGIVANVYKKEGTIILDCPVYYGNSGGAVVQVTHHKLETHHHVIGVVSQFIPYSETWKNLSNRIEHTEISNSGYSVAVPMDFVFEMFGIVKK